jgi:hypothetical protein
MVKESPNGLPGDSGNFVRKVAVVGVGHQCRFSRRPMIGMRVYRVYMLTV